MAFCLWLHSAHGARGSSGLTSTAGRFAGQQLFGFETILTLLPLLALACSGFCFSHLHTYGMWGQPSGSSYVAHHAAGFAMMSPCPARCEPPLPATEWYELLADLCLPA